MQQVMTELDESISSVEQPSLAVLRKVSIPNVQIVQYAYSLHINM